MLVYFLMDDVGIIQGVGRQVDCVGREGGKGRAVPRLSPSQLACTKVFVVVKLVLVDVLEVGIDLVQGVHGVDGYVGSEGGVGGKVPPPLS